MINFYFFSTRRLHLIARAIFRNSNELIFNQNPYKYAIYPISSFSKNVLLRH